MSVSCQKLLMTKPQNASLALREGRISISDANLAFHQKTRGPHSLAEYNGRILHKTWWPRFNPKRELHVPCVSLLNARVAFSHWARESYPLTKRDGRVSTSDTDPTRGLRLFSNHNGRVSTPMRGLRGPLFCYDNETCVQGEIHIFAVTESYESRAVTLT